MKRKQAGMKVFNLCMMGAAVAIVFVVCPYSSYGQDDCSAFAYCNPTAGYKISGSIVLDEPTQFSTAVGSQALVNAPTGDFNTAVGYSALQKNSTGTHNTAVGQNADVDTTTGSSNTAVGTGAIGLNTTGSDNTAVGDLALNLSNGSFNTALGWHACINITTGSNVMCLGANAGPAANVAGPATYIAGIFGRALTGTHNPEVCIDKTGKLGTIGCLAPSSADQEAINQTQAQQIADLQGRLSQLESLIAEKLR